MYLLYESPVGYALFKVSDRATHLSAEDLAEHFTSESKCREIMDLVTFKKFKDMSQAVEAASSICDGELGGPLKKFLKRVVPVGVDQLGVAESKLGTLIQDKYKLNCMTNGKVAELIRGVRSHFKALIAKEMQAKEFLAMSLGLAHSLCRYKMKFDTDHLDTMVIQAVGLLEDLDREINNYVMRCREWYSWHFPELSAHIADGIEFVKAVKIIGTRQKLDLRPLVKEFGEQQANMIEKLCLHSMGTEITEIDELQIMELCREIDELNDYRGVLNEYMQGRMNVLAPNVTALVGELLGAKLIGKAGSLVNLAKSASSTVQILGAEKALFRALKVHRETPKYGLLFHAQLVANAPAKLKGKMARMLAAKVSLSARVDSFRTDADDADVTMALNNRARLETRLQSLMGDSKGKLEHSQSSRKSSSWTPKIRPDSYDISVDCTLPTSKSTTSMSPLIQELNAADHDGGDSVKRKDAIKVESLDLSTASAGDTGHMATGVDSSSLLASPSDQSVEKKRKKKKKKKKQKQTQDGDTSQTFSDANGDKEEKADEEEEGINAAKCEATQLIKDESAVHSDQCSGLGEEKKKKKKKRKHRLHSESQEGDADESEVLATSVDVSAIESNEQSFSRSDVQGSDSELRKKKKRKKDKKIKQEDGSDRENQ